MTDTATTGQGQEAAPMGVGAAGQEVAGQEVAGQEVAGQEVAGQGAARPDVARGWWLTRLADHNPFYLLSGVCLLLGCFLVSSAVGEEREWAAGLLLGLLATTWAYELIALGLGIYLVRRLGLTRDGAYLLAVALVLFVDGALLYNELMMLAPRLASGVAIAALVLAAVKLGVLVRLLGVPLNARAWVLVGVSLGVLLSLPGAVRTLAQAEMLSAAWLYGAWWLAGALVALHGLERLRRDVGEVSAVARFLRGAVLVLPWGSVVGHLLALHYVFEQALLLDHVGPMLLGLMVYVCAQMRGPGQGRAVVAAILGLWAVIVSLPAAAELDFTLVWAGDWPVTSLRLMLIAAGLAWLAVAAAQRRGWWLTGLSLLVFVLAGAGHTRQAIREGLVNWWHKGVEHARGLLPETQMQWGLTVLVLAFVFLAVGLAVSVVGARLRRRGGGP